MKHHNIGRASERGSAISLALVMVIVLSGVAAAMTSISFLQNRFSSEENLRLPLTYAAEAGLEEARMKISTSLEDVNGNAWLLSLPLNAAPATINMPRIGDVQAEFIRIESEPGRVIADVRLYAYTLDTISQKYRLLAHATLPGETEFLRGDRRSVTIAQDISAWDTFARYATFVNSEDIQLGFTKVDGHIHSNRHVHFHEPGAEFTSTVSAVEGFVVHDPADLDPVTGNITIAQRYSNARPVPMPTDDKITQQKALAQGDMVVTGDNPNFGSAGDIIDAELIFDADKVTVVATNRSTGVTAPPVEIDINNGSTLFVNGKVTGARGTLSKRVTVVAEQSIDVTGNLTYVDSANRPAYVVTDPQGAAVPGNNTASDVVWGQNGYSYVENPAYAPQADAPPSLGLMTRGDIVLGPTAPYNLEVHASLFSLEGNWQSDLASKRGNLRMFGSVTTDKAGYRARVSSIPDPNDPNQFLPDPYGYIKSGGYIYDRNLLDNPPPGWLKVYTPIWGPRWESSSK